MIVVTGATGHVGNVLVRSLVAQGATGVRALVGPSGRTDSLAGIDVEMVEADMRDYESLVRVFREAEVVYHAAGIVSISAGGLNRLRPTNVEGTRNVLSACRKVGVGRLIYTSSVHALVEPPCGTCLDESSPVDPAGARGPYSWTKAEATRLVLDAAKEGLDAVVVYPSGIVGPYDFRLSYLGRYVRDRAQGRLKLYVDGGYNFVDVRDVVQGMMAAAERGRPGEGYLLAGHQVSVAELINAIEDATGSSTPRWRVPMRVARAVSFIMPAYYWMRREQPLFTAYSLDVIASNCSMNHEKAQRELGFRPRPFQQTLEDTIGWFRQGSEQASPRWLGLPVDPAAG